MTLKTGHKPVLSDSEVNKLADLYETKTAEEVLRDAAERFLPDIGLASSFGAEDVVVIDLISRVNKDIRIFTLDTGRLHQETYDVIDKIRDKYGIKIDIYFPESEKVEQIVRDYGFNLFYKSIENRRLCCNVRKVQPLKRALSGLNAWITGLRREQSVTRTDVKKIEIDSNFGGIIKFNPIIDWTKEDVWNHIKNNNVPYNTLHEKGFPSIGCAPCTRAVKPEEDERAGRWWWETPDKKECGLHK